MLNEAIACHYNARVPLRDLGWAAFSKSRGHGVVPNSSYTPYSHLVQSFSLSLFQTAYPIGYFIHYCTSETSLYPSQIFQFLLLACQILGPFPTAFLVFFFPFYHSSFHLK